INRLPVPAGAGVAIYAVAWIVTVTLMVSLGVVTGHPKAMLFLVGLLNGGVIAMIVLPLAEQPFYKGLTTFLGGITFDTLGSGSADQTAAGRMIGGIAASVQQAATVIAAQFGSSLGALNEGTIRVSLWTTLSVIVATLFLGVVVNASRQKRS